MFAKVQLPEVGHPAARTATGRITVEGRTLAILLLAAGAGRLAFAATLGLGVDESYMVAAGRHVQLSYFDHPPLAWWLSWAAGQALGSDSPVVVRLPFILLFAISTFLTYRLGAMLFSRKAGLWAAVALNVSPVFGVTTGSWVLPDGPLDCALLGFAICLVHALMPTPRAGRWWIGAGVCAGLALLSKYSAVLVLAGAPLYILTQPADRRWLWRPEPWLAAAIALLLFSPVLIWNADHHWASFAFQGGRAAAGSLHVFGPIATLAGEALFILPWIWLPLMLTLVRAARRGPAEPRGWLLSCLAIGPIVTFALVSVWAHGHVLFHWAAPGYLMLFPLLGAMIADPPQRRWRRLMLGSAVMVAAATVVIGTEVRLNWLPATIGDFPPGRDPDMQAVDWTSLKPEFAARGLIGPGTPVVAAIRWYDAGKLDYALGGSTEVICLGTDPREYGIIDRASPHLGQDVLIVAPRTTLAQIRRSFRAQFQSIEPLRWVTIRHAGRMAMSIPMFLGRDLRLPR